MNKQNWFSKTQLEQEKRAVLFETVKRIKEIVGQLRNYQNKEKALEDLERSLNAIMLEHTAMQEVDKRV